MAPANPWATSRTEDFRDVPTTPEPQTNAYAVPPLSAGDAFMDEFGWAGHLAPRTSTVETPSAQRLQTIRRYDYAARAEEPSENFRQDIDLDREHRYSVEAQDANGWTELKGVKAGDIRWAPNPRLTPPPEPRPMTSMSPRTYSFTRFFDQWNRTHEGDPLTGSARTFNGSHFSMADHRRNYEILGTKPPQSRRNTYRLEPGPWDIDVVDMPPNNGQPPMDARVRSMEVPAGSRSYRLG